MKLITQHIRNIRERYVTNYFFFINILFGVAHNIRTLTHLPSPNWLSTTS